MIMSRREALLTGSIILHGFPTSRELFGHLTIRKCSDLICNFTPNSIREIIKRENKFLYRGDDILGDQVSDIVDLEPDLLVEGTYDNPSALKYFECFEGRLGIFAARPSTGHIATSDQQEAGKWGDIVSVWPLGSSWAYVWPEDTATFFPSKWKDHCYSSDLVLNRGLELALQRNREVLFTSWFDDIQATSWPEEYRNLNSAFLIVSARCDSQLKTELQKQNYGLD